MSLSCSCSYDDAAWWYSAPNDYSTLTTKKRKRCSSCHNLIDIGSIVAPFRRWRSPESEIEERIYGDEIPLATMYLCEHCADMYFNFEALGFECVSPNENMNELLKDYHDVYGGVK